MSKSFKKTMTEYKLQKEFQETIFPDYSELNHWIPN